MSPWLTSLRRLVILPLIHILIQVTSLPDSTVQSVIFKTTVSYNNNYNYYINKYIILSKGSSFSIVKFSPMAGCRSCRLADRVTHCFASLGQHHGGRLSLSSKVLSHSIHTSNTVRKVKPSELSQCVRRCILITMETLTFLRGLFS